MRHIHNKYTMIKLHFRVSIKHIHNCRPSLKHRKFKSNNHKIDIFQNPVHIKQQVHWQNILKYNGISTQCLGHYISKAYKLYT